MNSPWLKLSLEEAQGFITGYSITYNVVSRQARRQAVTEHADPEVSYKVIGNLVLTYQYSVTVSATTRVGQGVSSDPTSVESELK